VAVLICGEEKGHRIVVSDGEEIPIEREWLRI
jgi:hypothetical protein